MRSSFWGLAIVLALPAAASAQNIDNENSYEFVMQQPVPVIEGDVLNRPYRVIGHITASIRKATVFSRAAGHDKVFRELWERGQKLGADAVIHAQYGQASPSYWSAGAREVRGEAIKFLTPEEVANRAAHP